MAYSVSALLLLVLLQPSAALLVPAHGRAALRCGTPMRHRSISLLEQQPIATPPAITDTPSTAPNATGVVTPTKIATEEEETEEGILTTLKSNLLPVVGVAAAGLLLSNTIF